jgi:hypothetical protein
MFEQVRASSPCLGLLTACASLDQFSDPRLNRLHLLLKFFPVQTPGFQRAPGFKDLFDLFQQSGAEFG